MKNPEITITEAAAVAEHDASTPMVATVETISQHTVLSMCAHMLRLAYGQDAYDKHLSGGFALIMREHPEGNHPVVETAVSWPDRVALVTRTVGLPSIYLHDSQEALVEGQPLPLYGGPDTGAQLGSADRESISKIALDETASAGGEARGGRITLDESTPLIIVRRGNGIINEKEERTTWCDFLIEWRDDISESDETEYVRRLAQGEDAVLVVSDELALVITIDEHTLQRQRDEAEFAANTTAGGEAGTSPAEPPHPDTRDDDVRPCGMPVGGQSL